MFELSRLLSAYADGTALGSIALMASTVLSVLLLQKPFYPLKQKGHFALLERSLLSWKKRDIAELLLEGCSIQSRLTKSIITVVMSTTGGTSNAATIFCNKLASNFSDKWDLPCNTTLAWMRSKLSLAIPSSSIHCLRGAHLFNCQPSKSDTTPANLVRSEYKLNVS